MREELSKPFIFFFVLLIRLKIREINPCPESVDGINVEFDIEFSINLDVLVGYIEAIDVFNSIQFFENSNILWVKGSREDILIEKEGLITIYNLDDIQNGINIVKRIMNIMKKMENDESL